MTGVYLEVQHPTVFCRLQSGGEVVGTWVFDFGPAATQALVAPSIDFWTYPKLDLGVETNRVVTWKRGEPVGDDAKAFVSALSILRSTRQSDFQGNCSDGKFRVDLPEIIRKPTTYFAYQYREEDRFPDLPYNLHFFVLDVAVGIMYELIDTSGGSFKWGAAQQPAEAGGAREVHGGITSAFAHRSLAER